MRQKLVAPCDHPFLSISTLFNISDIFTLVGRQDIHFIKKIPSVLLLLFQLGQIRKSRSRKIP